MLMHRFIKKIFCFMLISVLFFFVLLMAIKIMAYQNALKKDSIWNRDNKCELITYIPDYRLYGGIGRVLRLFSNQSFFVVYDKTGEKIKSSAWHFWEYQFSDLVAPGWSGIDFLYPSDSGFSGWTLPECKKK